MTFDNLLRAAATVAAALAETTARFAYAALAGLALLLAVAARGGMSAEAVDAAGLVAVAVLVAWAAFTAAAHLLTADGSAREVPA